MEQITESCGVRHDFAREFARGDDVPQVAEPLARNGLQQGQEDVADDGDAGPGVIQHVLILMRLGQGADRNRHGTNLDGAEETVEKVRAVQQDEHDALLRPNAEIAKDISGAVGVFEELLIGDSIFAAFNGDIPAAAFVDIAVNEMSCYVKGVGQVYHRLASLPKKTADLRAKRAEYNTVARGQGGGAAKATRTPCVAIPAAPDRIRSAPGKEASSGIRFCIPRAFWRWRPFTRDGLCSHGGMRTGRSSDVRSRSERKNSARRTAPWLSKWAARSSPFRCSTPARRASSAASRRSYAMELRTPRASSWNRRRTRFGPRRAAAWTYRRQGRRRTR